MLEYVIGIDLGGTNIKAVVMSEDGVIKDWVKVLTEADKGPVKVTEKIFQVIQYLVLKNDITKLKGISVGVPGLVNSLEGKVVFLPNLIGWKDIPLVDLINSKFKVPTIIDNDVRMAAYGEKFLGAGRDRDDVVCIALGTGIGSGIFIGGKILRGSSESAGEIGHITVDKNGLLCNCGNYGCLEMYASGRGIARRAKEAVKKSPSSIILQLVDNDVLSISAATVSHAAVQGDNLALEIIEETATYLGIALANLANILNPQRIILGGGVMGMGDFLLIPTKKIFNSRAMLLTREAEIVIAELGEKAGAIGAAEMFRKTCP